MKLKRMQLKNLIIESIYDEYFEKHKGIFDEPAIEQYRFYDKIPLLRNFNIEEFDKWFKKVVEQSKSEQNQKIIKIHFENVLNALGSAIYYSKRIIESSLYLGFTSTINFLYENKNPINRRIINSCYIIVKRNF